MSTRNPTVEAMDIRKALSRIARIGDVIITKNRNSLTVEITRPVVTLNVREEMDNLLNALGWSVVSWQQYQTSVTVKTERKNK